MKQAKVGKTRAVEKKLSCPKCSQEMQLRMRIPKRKMIWSCVCGWDQPKFKHDNNENWSD